MPNENIKDAVLASYEAQRAAMVRGDATALGEELSENFTLTHMTGYVQHRNEWLRQVATGEMRYHAIQDVDIRADAGAVADKPVVLARTRADATIWGSRGVWPLELKVHFIERDGRWVADHTVASTW